MAIRFSGKGFLAAYFAPSAPVAAKLTPTLLRLAVVLAVVAAVLAVVAEVLEVIAAVDAEVPMAAPADAVADIPTAVA